MTDKGKAVKEDFQDEDEQEREGAKSTPEQRGAKKYRGVSLIKKTSRFVARISDQHKVYYLGSFETAEEAAHRYDTAAREKHGRRAVLNFPKAGDSNADVAGAEEGDGQEGDGQEGDGQEGVAQEGASAEVPAEASTASGSAQHGGSGKAPSGTSSTWTDEHSKERFRQMVAALQPSTMNQGDQMTSNAALAAFLDNSDGEETINDS